MSNILGIDVEVSDSLNNIISADSEKSNGVDGLEIGNGAFTDCKNIKSIILPERLESIDHAAFYGREKLQSITIPANVKNRWQYFWKMHWIISNKRRYKYKKYDSRNNCNAIIETKPNTLIYACKNTIIPKGVKKIEDSAF